MQGLNTPQRLIFALLAYFVLLLASVTIIISVKPETLAILPIGGTDALEFSDLDAQVDSFSSIVGGPGDASASGNFGSRERLKGELAVELSAVLAFSAIKNNDKIGLIIFSDRIEKFVPPRKGRRHVLRVLRELLYHRPTGQGTDIAGALEYLNRVVSRWAVVFLVSDFMGDTGHHLTDGGKMLGPV